MTLFFAGGGTLGPVTPLLAVYQELMNRVGAGRDLPLRTVWIGTKNGPEREKLKLFPEIIFEYLPESKLPRFVSWKIVAAPFFWMLAALKCVSLIIKHHPSIIVGSGGFMQVPLIWVGKQFGIPCVIHQIDVAPTLSNKLCVWAAKRITVNFEVTAKHFPKEKTLVVGNPVFVPPQPPHPNENVGIPLLRKDGTGDDVFSPYEGGMNVPPDVHPSWDFEVHKPLLVVIGGGTGAEQLNQLVALTADELTKMFNVVLISGGRDVGRGTTYCTPMGLHVTPFVQDAYHLLEKADLVVTRAGMGTLTELASLGKPMVIIPIPHSHQEANARYYEEQRAAKVFCCGYDDTKLRAWEFVGLLKEMLDNQGKKEELSKNVRRLYNENAAKLIVEEIERFLIPDQSLSRGYGS